MKGRRPFLLLCALLLLISALGWLSLVSFQERQLRQQAERLLGQQARLSKESLVNLMLEGKGARFFDAVLRNLSVGYIEAVRLLDVNGAVIASSRKEEHGRLLPPPPVQPKLQRDAQEGVAREIFLPIYNNQPCQGCHGRDKDVMAVLSVEISTQEVLQAIGQQRDRALLLFLLVHAALLGCLALLLGRFYHRPLRRLSMMLRRVRDEPRADLTALKEMPGPLRELSQALEGLLRSFSQARAELASCQVDAMRKMQKMASLGELAAAVAHEIKNPLAGISGAIQVLAEDMSPQDPRREIIQEVLSEIDRLDRSIKDLLTFARPPQPRRVKTSLLDVLERAKRFVEAKARQQGVELKTMVADTSTEAWVDPEQMYQVFLNLMLNALGSMPGGGTLSVGMYSDPQENTLEVSFSDTGEGIPPESLKDIFKPFFTTKHSGTGLGLAISLNIVEAHGGRIEVESLQGLGSTFRVIIPQGEDVQG
jgi:signal transduction histidine kinase